MTKTRVILGIPNDPVMMDMAVREIVERWPDLDIVLLPGANYGMVLPPVPELDGPCPEALLAPLGLPATPRSRGAQDPGERGGSVELHGR